MKIAAGILLLIVVFEAWLLHRNSLASNQLLLPPYYFGEVVDNSYFSATGSWVSDTKLANPAQTIELSCDKEYGYCTETIAQVSDENYLSVSSTLYPIALWNSSQIIAKSSSSACVDYVITISLLSKSVTALRTTKSTTGFCEGMSAQPIASRLDDGMKRIDTIRTQK